MHRWRLGTMGFSYSDWSGVFYPKGLKQTDWLEFYARHFDAVELDTTFHAVPTIERVRAWRDATPDEFRFSVKTPKSITHAGAHHLVGAVAPMKQFLDVTQHLDEKFGVVLLQFPPSFSSSEAGSLRKFLSAMPRDVRFAIEFRHDSWFAPHTIELLREHRCCWVSAEYTHEPRQLTPTTDFLYIRWIGDHERFPTMDRQRVEMSARLRVWAERIALHAGVGIETVWGFFNNDYSGFAVASCEQFKRLVGQPVVEREDEKQGRLFA